MIKLLKASAGSGKTYQLSHNYIDLLLDPSVRDPFAYRHILAVTFTNKATEEMKSRIISDLYKISKDEDDSRHLRAGKVLSNILHDYSAFNVSTIDRFFQQTLRSFAREMGHFNSYQVELDKEMLTNEAVDRILDSLGNDPRTDKDIIGYILESMDEKLSSGKSIKIEDDLKSMAKDLKSESFSLKASAAGLDPKKDYSTSALRNMRKSCNDIVDDFISGLVSRSKAALESSSSCGISVSDYTRGWFSAFEKITRLDKKSKIDSKLITPAFMARLQGDEKDWFAKKNQNLVGIAAERVRPAVEDFLDFFNRGISLYNTALKISSNIYGLGVAARLFEEFDRLQKEKNVICLDESNTLLREIIDGSDAPFVYEKSGVWIDHYLLDEFQDTSVTQWDNFLPLLRESESKNSSNLIVGDVKQSIYRFRESNWNLLDSVVEEEFPGHVKKETLQKNYRSTQEVIDFNNDFYPHLALRLDQNIGRDDRKRIVDIYSDVRQVPGKDSQKGRGYVQLRFADEQQQLDSIVECIDTLVNEYGASPSDVAVLVRRNDKGTEVAQRLVEAGYGVVTEASLCIKNSITVRRLVSLMSWVDNPSDRINSRLAGDLGADASKLSYHSLPGLSEKLYALLCQDPECGPDCETEIPYTVAFVDYLMDYSRTQGNDLHDFLSRWADVNPTISSTPDRSSVRILTIHKSKGLDFPFVIVPFLEQLELYRDKTRCWSIPDKSADRIGEAVAGKLFNVVLKPSSFDVDAFDASYRDELYNQAIDAVNMMYVASTRASQGMLLMGNPKEGAFGTFADILYDYCGGVESVRGDMSSCIWNAAVKDSGSYPMTYPVYPLGSRLKVRPYASDFFTLSGNDLKDLPFRQRGIVLHDILSRVRIPSDLNASVRSAVRDGSIARSSADKVESFLAKRISSHPELFREDCKILNECTLVSTDGTLYRPDRVIVCPDGSAIVVDYKFGSAREEYEAQVSAYALSLRRMGYSRVSAMLWYVYKDELRVIEDQ